ncbi:hypothetical protein CEXT_504091 [Caerostris extrusa]|uniref:Uncharacterized protein n=1 Tax=Caerostris extrusa TaxID=172846 RepID=A0AAV4YED1_CAEEX|nr:hypothetical protein CEXT_504091 [Caerostris extrusa]
MMERILSSNFSSDYCGVNRSVVLGLFFPCSEEVERKTVLPSSKLSCDGLGGRNVSDSFVERIKSKDFSSRRSNYFRFRSFHNRTESLERRNVE